MNNNHLYTSKDLRLNTLFGEISFLGQLQRARVDYLDQHSNNDLNFFLDWMYDTHGVTVATQDGNLTAEYQVHDEQKYLLFKLKYA
jgi:hypothetical protein